MKLIRIIRANQKVYHGSPYKFDSFDQNKMGITDGNKYGWGIYFTSNPNFANSYGKGKETYNEKPLNVYESLVVPDLLKGKKKEVIDTYKDFKPEIVEFAKNFDVTKYKRNKGYVYTCSIPDANKLLDWDLPINSQPLSNILYQIAKDYNIDINDNTYGSQFYIKLEDKIGSGKQASLLLNKYGIPGSTYELNDQNFVIWDISKIKILEVK